MLEVSVREWLCGSSFEGVEEEHFIYHFLKRHIWLHQVLIVAHGIFSWGMWDLVPWPGMEPGPAALGAGVLATGPPGKAQRRSIFERKKACRGIRKRGLLLFALWILCLSSENLLHDFKVQLWNRLTVYVRNGFPCFTGWPHTGVACYKWKETANGGVFHKERSKYTCSW